MSLLGVSSVLLGCATVAAGGVGFERRLELVAPDGAPRDGFGTAVALDAGRALVGAPGRDGAAGVDSGGAYVFERTSTGTWACAAVLVPSDAHSGARAGVAVALDGQRALVGAPHLGKGFAYVFERLPSGAWLETQKIVGFDAQPGDLFGASVALDGDMLWCGAPLNDHGAGPDCGMVYDYRLVGSSWVHVQETQSYEGDRLGSAVALDGLRGIAGAPEAQKTWNERTGRLLVLEWDPVELWKHTAWLVPAGAQVADRFGDALALDGARIVAGAPGHAASGVPDAGAAYVFERSADGVWSEIATLLARDPTNAAAFGCSVALHGERAFVGAADAPNPFGARAGAVYAFDRAADGTWHESAKFARLDGRAGDRLGAAVAIDRSRGGAAGPVGTLALLGAPGSTSPVAERAGMAWLVLVAAEE
ncbi:MAG: FG-GAP repeat protein [Planctomycetes bacterium]|nr:FG-GAP repeat protein [Planctomycetota bacterium]